MASHSELSADDNDAPENQGPDNLVFLRGRLAAEPVLRQLPSGDVLASFRLTVARPVGDRGKVDSIDCVAVRVRQRQILARAVAGDELEVDGTLQRRFWRSPSGPASRYAVVVSAVRRRRRRTTASGATSRRQAVA